MHVSMSPLDDIYPIPPEYMPRLVVSNSSMICIALIFGAPETVPAGKPAISAEIDEVLFFNLPVTFETNFDQKSSFLYEVLRKTNPSPFMYYFNLPKFEIVGSSPEILVRLRSNEITIRPIAGTRPRGKNKIEDKKFESELMNDKKEIAEHLMLLDLGRNDVGKVSKKSTVKVTSKFKIERYSHVMHIVSNVTGKLKPDTSSISALMAGFPAGTVSGAPKIRAMQIIDELETTKRGIYSGGIGYISSNGDMDTCIVLRTGIIKRNKLYVQAGGGVVFDSDPEKEFNETVNKAKAVLNAAEIVMGNVQ